MTRRKERAALTIVVFCSGILIGNQSYLLGALAGFYAFIHVIDD